MKNDPDIQMMSKKLIDPDSPIYKLLDFLAPPNKHPRRNYTFFNFAEKDGEYDAEKVSEDEIMEVALEAGAEDITTEDGVTTVTTDPSSFDKVLEALQSKNFESLSAEVSMVPQAYTSVDADTAKKVAKLVSKLEEDEDVQNVYTTVEYPDDFDPDSVG